MKPKFMAVKLKDVIFIMVVLTISITTIVFALGMIAKAGS